MVGGADGDMQRLAEVIRKGGKKIDDISVTMDSHRAIHIAHGDFWRDDAGNQPGPFTIIAEADVIGKNPKWHTYNPGDQKWAEKYVQALAKKGRNPLCIWPKHCVWGSHGWQLYPVFQEALQAWAEKEYAIVNVCFKGYNYRTEWYSAVAADVQDPEDASTGLNADFVDRFADADLFVVTGEALSHCVLWTFTDIVERLGDKFIKKCLLLTDCTSPVGVPMFVQAAEAFVKKYQALGMQTATAAEFLSGM
jgi:nicotinamidase-related amidase